MGLRFRKSISIIPGVKMNFGMSGVSVSAGAPGFRKTIHSSGRVTSTVGLPGTGISYVTTSNANKKNAASPSRGYGQQSYNGNEDYIATPNPMQQTSPLYQQVRDIDIDAIKSIHKTCDETVDWTEILVNATPTDEMYDKELWAYLHSVADDILNGDIDTYLKVIYNVNPLNDLLDFGSNFEFGTDDPRKIEVEFSIQSEKVMPPKNSLGSSKYFDLLQDYVCSCSIRVARDMLALLPVKTVVVHAVDNQEIILSVVFDRTTMNTIKFGFIDPSDTMSKFEHNMKFELNSGFKPVEAIT